MASVSGTANNAINAIIVIVVLFLLYANLVPEMQSAGDTLNATGVPLGGLFSSSGFVVLLVMVGLLLAVIKFAMGRKN